MSPSATAEEYFNVRYTHSNKISKNSNPNQDVVANIPINIYMDFIKPHPDEAVIPVNRIETLGVGRRPNNGINGELIALGTKTPKTFTPKHLDRIPITRKFQTGANAISRLIVITTGPPLLMPKNKTP
jgi:hypothetical protein